MERETGYLNRGSEDWDDEEEDDGLHMKVPNRSRL